MSKDNKITAVIRFEYYGIEADPILEIENANGFSSEDLFIGADIEIVGKEFKIKDISIKLLQKSSVRDYDIYITVCVEDI